MSRAVREPRSTAAPVLPMKPQRKALVAFSLIFAVWIVVLITVYLTAVRPHRKPAEPPASPEPAAPIPQSVGLN